MRIFSEKGSWRSANLNFVDDNNRFVGFDYHQDCCEDFGYTISPDEDLSYERVANEITPDREDWPGYNFDPEYGPVDVENDTRWCDGGVVRFKLVHATEEPLYLYLYNHHNGYYAHGYSYGENDNTAGGGSL